MVSGASVQPSKLEVDFDKNITTLYDCITRCDWDEAIKACKAKPEEAKTWVVRHYESEHDDEEDDDDEAPEIMWRFLPIHSACARQPPSDVISALLEAYPDAARCIDDQGMYALHYACGNQASREVVRLLLKSFPKAAKLKDPRGMLPIHYLACWGPSSVSVVDMVLVANRDVAESLDDEGNTPMDLATEGDYDDRPAVVDALKRWLKTSTEHSVVSSTSKPAKQPQKETPRTISIPIEAPKEEKKEQESIKDSDTRSTAYTFSSYANPPIIHVTTPTNNSDHPNYSSPRMMNSLQQEVNRMKIDIKRQELTFKGKLEAKEKEAVQEREAFQSTIDDLSEERDQNSKQINELQADLQEKDSEITKLKSALEKSGCERDGLRQTLADLTDQHDKFQKKNDRMNERLGSLNASLTSMMEQQTTVLDAMKAREDHFDDVQSVRRQKIRELLDVEKNEEKEPDSNLKNCLLKQTREMEAIAAVIAAARE